MRTKFVEWGMMAALAFLVSAFSCYEVVLHTPDPWLAYFAGSTVSLLTVVGVIAYVFWREK